MIAPLAHRGPDGDGLYVDGPVALGHRRLSIIDPALGAQPMSNEDGTVWVTYNGELYNEPALRAGLAAPGPPLPDDLRHRDPRPSLRGGGALDFVRHLNGMFALAIWDAKAAPPRPGPRPDGPEAALLRRDCPAAASSSAPSRRRCWPIRTSPGRLDPAGLARYLFYEYVPAPGSIWAGMRKLPAAHLLVWEDDRGRVDRATGSRPLPIAGGRGPAVRRGGPAVLGRLPRGGRPAPAVGRAARGLPLGRGRLVERRGGPGRARAAGVDPDLLDRLRRPELRRERPRPGRRPSTSGPTTTSGPSPSRTCCELLPEVAGWLDEPFGDASILPTHLLSRFARGRRSRSASAATAPTSCWPATRPSPPSGRPGSTGDCRGRRGGSSGRRSAGCRSTTGTSASTSSSSSSSGALAEPSPLAHQRWIGSFSGPELADLLAGAAGGRRRGRAPGPRRGDRPGRRPADPVAPALPGDAICPRTS